MPIAGQGDMENESASLPAGEDVALPSVEMDFESMLADILDPRLVSRPSSEPTAPRTISVATTRASDRKGRPLSVPRSCRQVHIG